MPWSESVYLDCVTEDGKSGFITRLARHTEEGTAWLWAHVFHGGSAYSFNRNDLPCSDERANGDEERADYTQEGSAHFSRTGRKTAPIEGTALVEVSAHAGMSAPETEGSTPVVIEATFRPAGPAGSNLPGRTEALGRVSATVKAGEVGFTVEGLGQFHEQHQDAPRFTVPFTYGTLRGERLGLVFLIGPRLSGGFVQRDGVSNFANCAEISQPGRERSLRVDLDDGSSLSVALETTRQYLLPIHGHDRSSSVVVGSTSEGDRLSGCVNDWTPPSP